MGIQRKVRRQVRKEFFEARPGIILVFVVVVLGFLLGKAIPIFLK